MNLQDCINIIKNCTALACEYHIKHQCKYDYEVRENRFECTKKLEIKALEKQIPKLVHEQQWTDTKCDCGYVFSKSYEDGYYDIPYKNKTNYCPNCGQHLYWR